MKHSKTSGNIKIENLQVLSPDNVRILHDIGFEISSDESVGIIGESGSGKTTLLLSILGILSHLRGYKVSGKIFIDNYDVLNTEFKNLTHLFWQHVGFVLQDPYSVFDPYRTIGPQIEELIKLKQCKSHPYKSVLNILKRVGFEEPESIYKKFPFELSGGMLQRCSIALSITCEPNILALDEPTSNLDSVNRLKILDLIQDIKKNQMLNIIYITHNIRILKKLVDKVIVLYRGTVIEIAPTHDLISNPLHPYSRVLISTSLRLSIEDLDQFSLKKGHQVEEQGCVFKDRCPYYFSKCETDPPMFTLKETNREVKCWLYEENGQR